MNTRKRPYLPPARLLARLGRLVQKKDGSGNILAAYYYDGNSLAYETTPTGTVTYQWAGGRLLSQRQTVSGTSNTYWYMLDAVGNVRALVDDSSSNNLKAMYVYDAFGNIQPSSFEALDIENPLRYRANSGYVLLMEPQQEVSYALYNAGARTYNTDTGRWLQEDPLLGIPIDPMSFNRYLYCNADPVNRNDPSGLVSVLNEGRSPYFDPSDPVPNFLAPSKPGPTLLVPPMCPGWSHCVRNQLPRLSPEEEDIRRWADFQRRTTYTDMNVDLGAATAGVIFGSDGSTHPYAGYGYFSSGFGFYVCSAPTPGWSTQGSYGFGGGGFYLGSSDSGFSGGLGVSSGGWGFGRVHTW